jgi:hypothetical protein
MMSSRSAAMFENFAAIGRSRCRVSSRTGTAPRGRRSPGVRLEDYGKEDIGRAELVEVKPSPLNHCSQSTPADLIAAWTSAGGVTSRRRWLTVRRAPGWERMTRQSTDL